jgi:hypothetical protein
MKRREFVALIGGAAATWPLAVGAQQSERMRRVGVLIPRASNDPESRARIAAFQQGLQQWGWTEGRNARIDILWPGGSARVCATRERLRRIHGGRQEALPAAAYRFRPLPADCVAKVF